MRAALPWLLAASFAVHVVAHVALVAALARERAWWRAVAALVVSPLAPFWGWKAGVRRPVYAWAAGLLGYAACVIVAG